MAHPRPRSRGRVELPALRPRRRQQV